MTYTVDKFEGSFVILERETDSSMVEIDRSKLPVGIKEGDLLSEDNGVFTILTDETQKRKAKITNLMNNLFED